MIHNISRFIAALALLATAQGAWAEWTGFGVKSNPYIISTPEDLLLLAHRVNGTNGETANDYQGRYFKLGADITFSHDEYEPGFYTENYEAIGGYIDGTDRFFKGDFDGDGHTVSGIRIRKTTVSSINQGLFGYIGSGANIHDVHLTDARITGSRYVGGIAGYNNDAYIVRCSVTDSYITATGNTYYGTICGSTSNTYRFTNNYYHGCTVNGTAVTSGVGYNGADITANNGALPAYRLDLGDGVTIQTPMAADLGFSCDADNDGTPENYWRSGAVLTLGYTGTVPAGYLFDGLTATNGTVGGNANDGYTLTMPDQDVTITTAKTPDPAHFSVNDAGTEYTIKTTAGWNVFCDLLAENTMGYFSGKTVQLDADITVTRMAGGENHEFTGTFDGDGHTLTFNYTTTENYAAPFRNVESGCVIKNLHVSGTINTSAMFAAGLVGDQYGAVTIRNCRSSVTINSTISGDGTHAGFVARNGDGSGSVLTIEGCLFDGRLLGPSTNSCGGFIGWRYKAATITNSLFAPAEVTVQNDGSATFARDGVDTYNCYYTTLLNDGTDYVPAYVGGTETPNLWRNGKATRTVTAADDVTIDAVALTGIAIQYTVSGITAYSGGGLQLGQTLYYGSGDQLSLTLSNSATAAPQGYQYGYTASAGTLDGSTLTMPDADVTISAALAPIDWATVNKGDSDDPYMIYNKDQLDLLAHRVNGTHGETADEDGYSGKYFRLGADITYTYTKAWNEATTEDDNNYEAIGYYDGGTLRSFRGNFDGDGYTVSGIRIYRSGNDDADKYQGIFGLTDGANIHGLRLADARITGYDNTGGIVGNNYHGTVTDCHVASNVCIHAAQSNAWYHGGIAGDNAGTVENSTSAATLTIPTGATGCECYGAIAGNNSSTGTLRDNLAIGATVPATGNSYYGAIAGRNNNGGTLQRNYYTACTVNGTAVTSGKGCQGADLTDNNGALPAYRLDLGANITTPPGTFVDQTEWLATPPDGARLAPENGFTLAGNHYFASGYVFTPGSTLASGAAQGYTPRATLGGELLDLYTPTGDADPLAGKAIARLTVTADCDGKTLASTEAIYSTGQPVTVAYINADGTPGEASAIALDGTETSLAEGWYFVGKDISYTHTLTLGGDVTLILADGKTMKVRTTKTRGDGISAEGHSLHIYGQTEGTGALNAQTNGKAVGISITNGTLGIHGGNVNANEEGTVNTKSAICVERATAGDALVIDRGTLTANNNSSCGIYIEGGDVRINGGQVTATGKKLGIDISDYVDEDDESISIPGILTLSGGTLTASSFDTRSDESWAGTLAIAPGLTYTDGTSLYDSTTETATLAALAGKTLQPCLALADAANNTAAITDHAGQTLAVALSGRTLYKDGSWNTLCLPFAVDLTASGPLSGDNVQAMTLNTSSSNLADGTLTLNFDAAETIPAGTPFIIKWDNTGVNITSPVFIGVTVSNTTNDATVEGVLTFTGTYAPVRIGSEGDNTKLYLGAANKLYYPNAAMTIGTHRAYFQLAEGITAGEPTSAVRAFALNFGDDEATGIISVHDSGFMVNGSDAWYTLDGRRLDGVPTAKGLYIHGGKKVAIK